MPDVNHKQRSQKRSDDDSTSTPKQKAPHRDKGNSKGPAKSSANGDERKSNGSVNDEKPASGNDLPSLPEDGYFGYPDIERYRQAISAELTQREKDLQRRENALGERAAAFDRERRQARMAEELSQQRQETELSQARANQAELNSRLERCEELIADLEREQAELDAERSQLRSHRETMRETLRDELALDRGRFETEREALRAEKAEFRKRVESHEREATDSRQEWRANWEAEREALREQLTAKLALEFADERREFDEERLLWEATRDRELSRLEDGRSRHDERLARAETDLSGLREELEREFQERRSALEEEIGRQVSELDTRIAERQAAWERDRRAAEDELERQRRDAEAERRAGQEELERARREFEIERDDQLRRLERDDEERRQAHEEERGSWHAERQAVQAALEADSEALEQKSRDLDEHCRTSRQALDEELEEHRRRTEQESDRLRVEWEQERESARRALDEERAATENRLRFQQDHLARTTEELEQARREVDLRIQQARTQAVAWGETARLRRRQLDRYRTLLARKEESLERERRALSAARRHAAAKHATEQDVSESLPQEPIPTGDGTDEAQQELRTELVERSQGLAQRQARLDTLRVEIEATHRENTELRMAIDDAWARLSGQAGTETARAEYLTSRDFVAGYFRRREASLQERYVRLESDSESARRDIAHLDQRRTELERWLTSSMTTLRRRQEELQRFASGLGRRETRLHDSVASLANDRLEAERIIRELLEQLSVATNETPRLTVDPAASGPAIANVGEHRAAG